MTMRLAVPIGVILVLWIGYALTSALWFGSGPRGVAPYVYAPLAVVIGAWAGHRLGRHVSPRVIALLLTLVALWMLLGVVLTAEPGKLPIGYANANAAMAVQLVALAGLAGAARPLLARLAQRRRVWWGATAVNLTAMTLYLWHLPVLIALVAVTHLLGLDRPVTWTAVGPAPGPGYWLWTIGFLAVDLAGVVAVVRVLWVVEVGRLPWWDVPARSDAGPGSVERRRGAAAASGAALIGIGTLMLAATGLAGFPTRVTQFAGLPLSAPIAIGLMAAGGVAVRQAGGITSIPRRAASYSGNLHLP